MHLIRSTLPRVLAPSLLLAVLALGACGMSTPMSRSTNLTARLSGASEVPATMGAGSGTLEARLMADSRLLTWTLTYSGLSGPATAAHFHGPAAPGQNAGVVVPMSAPLASPITGTATLTPAQAADLSSGKWYVNVHTAANPGGEIRGQVEARP